MRETTIKPGVTVVAGAFKFCYRDVVVVAHDESDVMVVAAKLGMACDPAKFRKVQIIKAPKEESHAG